MSLINSKEKNTCLKLQVTQVRKRANYEKGLELWNNRTSIYIKESISYLKPDTLDAISKIPN